MEIKSAQGILFKYISDKTIDQLSSLQLNQIREAMKEYAEQFVDMAAENSRLKYRNISYKREETLYEYRGYEGYDDDPISVKVDKESILNIKDLIK